MSLTTESLVGRTMMHISQDCAQCGTETRCRRRDFNPQTWSVLLVWGEVEKHAVDQPICDDCYSDLRDILIERADEVANVLKNPIKEQPTVAAKGDKKELEKKPAAAKKKPAAAKKQKKRTSKVA